MANNYYFPKRKPSRQELESGKTIEITANIINTLRTFQFRYNDESMNDADLNGFNGFTINLYPIGWQGNISYYEDGARRNLVAVISEKDTSDLEDGNHIEVSLCPLDWFAEADLGSIGMFRLAGHARYVDDDWEILDLECTERKSRVGDSATLEDAFDGEFARRFQEAVTCCNNTLGRPLSELANSDVYDASSFDPLARFIDDYDDWFDGVLGRYAMRVFQYFARTTSTDLDEKGNEVRHTQKMTGSSLRSWKKGWWLERNFKFVVPKQTYRNSNDKDERRHVPVATNRIYAIIPWFTTWFTDTYNDFTEACRSIREHKSLEFVALRQQDGWGRKVAMKAFGMDFEDQEGADAISELDLAGNSKSRSDDSELVGSIEELKKRADALYAEGGKIVDAYDDGDWTLDGLPSYRHDLCEWIKAYTKSVNGNGRYAEQTSWRQWMVGQNGLLISNHAHDYTPSRYRDISPEQFTETKPASLPKAIGKIRVALDFLSKFNTCADSYLKSHREQAQGRNEQVANAFFLNGEGRKIGSVLRNCGYETLGQNLDADFGNGKFDIDHLQALDDLVYDLSEIEIASKNGTEYMKGLCPGFVAGDAADRPIEEYYDSLSDALVDLDEKKEPENAKEKLEDLKRMKEYLDRLLEDRNKANE